MWQAEIDSACETIDFLRFNATYASELYKKQPTHHSENVWNKVQYRPLEGFVVAISPFNFTAIGSNLVCTPAQMGNGVLWKPSSTCALSNYYIMKVLKEAGLPDGVIQFLPSEPLTFGNLTINSPDLSALSFTGSTQTFKKLWKQVGNNIDNYKTYPRIIGETGGKNYHLMHPSADLNNFVFNTIRGSFEYSGQKCSATSRAYVPKSKWEQVKSLLISETKKLKVGQCDDPKSFLSSVIDEISFNKISGFIDRAKKDKGCEILAGGDYDKSIGYFVNPTIIKCNDPKYETMEKEIFGPVLSIYVYEDQDYEKTIELINNTSEYSLTGAIFAKDRLVIAKTSKLLENSSGNFYINDKSTGAVVGQQPFWWCKIIRYK